MSRRRLALIVIALGLLGVIGAAGIAGGWLLYTQAGLEWLTTRVVGYAGKGLTLEGVAGTLAGGASVEHIRYAGKDIEVHALGARLRVSPLSLFTLTPRLSELRATQLIVTSRPTEPRGRPPDTLVLPMNVQLPDVQVGRLTIDLGKGPMDLTNVRLAYAGGRSDHRVDTLVVTAFEHTVELSGSIGATPPFPLKGRVSGTRLEAPLGEAEASFKGKLTDIEFEGNARSGDARIDATVRVQPYEPLPLASIKAKIARLDLHAFVKALPQTGIDGELELAREGPLLAGPVRLTNARPGPIDKGRLPVSALRMQIRTDAAKTRQFDLSADLGSAGAITGAGNLEGERAKLALSTRGLNLAGLHSRMRQTKLAGRADLVLERTRQSVTAAISQDELHLELVAQRAGNVVDVPKLVARARGGEARGDARVELSGGQPFAGRAAFTRFDPAAWGRFPAGSINGTLTASGALASREAEVRFAIADSRWLDAPLAARGQVAVAGERLRQADVEATIGGNQLFAKGAFGSPNDVLTVRIDAPRLAIVDKRLQGTLRGTAEVSGSWSAPGARFDLTGNDLVLGAHGRVSALTARGVVSTNPDGPANIDASARGIVTPEWQLRSASLRVEGTRIAHEALAQAQGEKVDFRARARGGWRAGGQLSGWSGTLQELVNSGEAAVSLAAPVALTVGPKRAHADAFELRVVGGRLNVSGLEYERGRLATAGRFNDLPVRPLLAVARLPATMGGTLRLSGDWSIRTEPHLAGSINVQRESGDLAFGLDRTIRIGMQALTLNATFAERGATVQAQLRSALATGNVEGTVTPVGNGGAARYTGASPIAFTASLDVARLAPFATFIDTAMLLDGELRAKITGAGTLANPLVTGPVTGERLAFALPAEGVDLKGGTLRAMLTQREIRIESFSIKGGDGVFHAQGTLARTGFDEAAVDWRAEKFTVLGRPDRRLVATGKGHAELKGDKLAFTGMLRADEGLFELSETSLPALGDDVVIVGREPPSTAPPSASPVATGERRTRRTSVDMSIDLGNNVQLRGRGLDVWLAGELKVTTDAQGQLRAAGTVDARRGAFAAYGQRLEIDRARLYFNGPMTNPGLDIVAMRKRQAVEAGVSVSGTLQRPLVRVVSNPQLPEGEALSWLVLGRAPDQAGAGQLAALPLATGALMGKAGAPLARALKVDEVGVRGGGGGSGTAAQQFLTIGKRITERFYLAFEQSLGGTENLLRLEYTLTQRIALRAQAGTTSSVGVVYRYSWD